MLKWLSEYDKQKKGILTRESLQNLLSDIESDVENIFLIGKKIFDDFDQKGDDWAAGWLLQVLKKHKPIFFNDKKCENCEKL